MISIAITFIQPGRVSVPNFTSDYLNLDEKDEECLRYSVKSPEENSVRMRKKMSTIGCDKWGDMVPKED